MLYIATAIINTVYGVLLLLSLNQDTPGFVLVLAIGSVLTIIGLVGFILWLKLRLTVNRDQYGQDSNLKNWFGFAKAFDIVLIIGLLFRIFVFQPFIVEGDSMEKNFHDQEILIVDKISYRFSEPRRGDVVIFQAPKNPQDDYIKRIIGLPGEKVGISKGKVYINGRLLNEPYLTISTKTFTTENGSVFQKTLGQKEYFVMGDNRNNSSDSREWGVMPRENIIGLSWLAIYPFNEKGLIPRISPAIDPHILITQ